MIEWSVVKIDSKDGSETRITFEFVPKSEWENGSLVLRFQSRDGYPENCWGEMRSAVMTPTEASEILCVLRGMKENLNEGKGFCKGAVETGREMTVKMSHRLCPCGYSFSATTEGRTEKIVIDERQALVLSLSLERFIPIIAFGDPGFMSNPLGFEDGKGGGEW